jgi:sec-independent protein translocase protein TatB
LSFLGMDIGWGELLIILIVGLLVVGPDKLPAYARKTARFVRQFQKVTSGLTGEISKAINLDDEEGGKSSDFKKDLIAVKKSLENDVAELKATLDGQASAISETIEVGTKDAAAQLEKNARDISDTLNTKAKAVSETVEARVKDVAAQLEQGAREVSAAVDTGDTVDVTPKKEESLPKPVSAPPPVQTSEAEVN